MPLRVKIPAPFFNNLEFSDPEKIPENVESEELLIVKSPPFRLKFEVISIVAAFKVKFNASELLEISALISINPPVNVKVALDPDVFDIAALTVSVFELELPVVIETLVPELSEDMIDEAKIVVFWLGVNELE